MKRVIARLDIKENRLVKGIHLEGWRFLPHSPNEYCYQYYTEGIDEIIYIDAVASLYNRNSLREIIKRTTDNVFIPITVGGGIRTIEDAKEILRCGADKIAICTQAVRTPEIISRVAEKFGVQCMVLSVQAKKDQAGNYKIWYDVAREKTEKDVVEWVQEAEELGAGEILLTSVDREGTEKGMDTELIEKVSKAVTVPVIACGGFSNPSDFVRSIQSGADAVAIAKALHYGKTSVKEIKSVALASNIKVRKTE
ncbi:MAG: imidazole glycerol phosphate synthase cyclase subunit [Bacteroidia bacterium]|jgi:cyclase|nr:imidazole glycerol phosphate synthase cyclase subunit [Bacteroidia bacterium]MCO5254586.1 imidazole glycerol phosphate synthase cyclase subunit [Bacteroidota bacterium]